VITFSNLRAAESLTFTTSERGAVVMLGALIDTARGAAADRWEQELAAWLDDRRWAIAGGVRAGLDLGELAFTPEHFPAQQRFVVAICEQASARAADPTLAADLLRLRELAAHHAREHVSVGRRWRWVGERPIHLPGPANIIKID
jgi:hypothetical protein